MSLGGQTVTVVAVTEDDNTRDRYNNPLKVRTETAVRGCRFRPTSYTEAVKLGDLAIETWRLTAPPVPAIMAAQAIDEIWVDGVKYQVVGGVRPYADMAGNLFKVTIICERRTG